MKVQLTTDPNHKDIPAILVLSDCRVPDPATGAAPTFSICDSAGQYLSADGQWQTFVDRIPMGGYVVQDGYCYIPLSHAVFLALDPLMGYQIRVGDDAAILPSWNELPSSVTPVGTGAMGQQSKPEQAPQPAATPLTPMESEPEPLPEEPLPEPEPVKETPPDDPGILTPLPPEEEKSSGAGRIVLILVVVALLAAAGGAVWYFLLRDRGADTVPEPPAVETPAQKEEPARPAPQSGPAFMSQARDHLKQNADPARSLELAKPTRTPDSDQETADGAFLLLEDAAQKGQPEAMFLVGQYYDPVCTLPRGTIQPDVAQAADWYRKAAQAGIAEAQPALDALKAHLETKARGGDEEAARQLELLK